MYFLSFENSVNFDFDFDKFGCLPKKITKKMGTFYCGEGEYNWLHVIRMALPGYGITLETDRIMHFSIENSVNAFHIKNTEKIVCCISGFNKVLRSSNVIETPEELYHRINANLVKMNNFTYEAALKLALIRKLFEEVSVFKNANPYQILYLSKFRNIYLITRIINECFEVANKFESYEELIKAVQSIYFEVSGEYEYNKIQGKEDSLLNRYISSYDVATQKILIKYRDKI